MKILPLVLFLALLPLIAFTQSEERYNARILISYPNLINTNNIDDSIFFNVIKNSGAPTFKPTEDTAGMKDYEKTCYFHDLEFADSFDYFSTFPKVIQSSLRFELFDYFKEDLFVIPTRNNPNIPRSTNNNMLCTKQNAAWLISIDSLSIYKNVDWPYYYGTIRLHLYNLAFDSILLDTTYSFKAENYGFSWTCKETELGCLNRTFTADIYRRLIQVMLSKEEYWH